MVSIRFRWSAPIWLSMGLGLWVCTQATVPQRSIAEDIDVEIGIIQRFGEEESDQLTIQSTPGDRLTVEIVDGEGQPQVFETQEITLEVAPLPLEQPQLDEHLVLSEQGTFETAEDNAQFWRSLGIEVEITQPDRWQVWAKRSVYRTPLLRRLLLQSLQEQGYTTPYISSEVLQARSVAAFELNGFRYHRYNVTLRSEKELFNLQKEGGATTQFAGVLHLQPNAYGTFTLVNEVPLETYLRGVVPYEIGPNAPTNAVEAQAIIARTYALRNLRRFEADNYELCASVHCQVYKGLQGSTTRIDQAIARTSGLVLTYNNELVDALYSSTTGGVTASFGDVWNGSERPYLKSVIDSPSQVWDLRTNSLADEKTFRQFIDLEEGFNETGRDVFRWQRSATLEELAETLKKYVEKNKHPLIDFQDVLQLEIIQRSPSGRILELHVTTDLGVVKLYKNEIRSALGPPISTLFYLEPVVNPEFQLTGYRFIGGGFGHGVGMSQYGSYNLAKLGWSAAKILEFYYPGTSLQPLNDSIIYWQEESP